MGVSRGDQPFETAVADFGFGEVVVHFREMSLYEEDLIFKARDDSIHQFIIEHLFLRSRDESGSRIWKSKADREKIAMEFDAKEVKRVVNLMCEVKSEPGN